jgi:hypothetical protein
VPGTLHVPCDCRENENSAASNDVSFGYSGRAGAEAGSCDTDQVRGGQRDVRLKR